MTRENRYENVLHDVLDHLALREALMEEEAQLGS